MVVVVVRSVVGPIAGLPVGHRKTVAVHTSTLWGKCADACGGATLAPCFWPARPAPDSQPPGQCGPAAPAGPPTGRRTRPGHCATRRPVGSISFHTNHVPAVPCPGAPAGASGQPSGLHRTPSDTSRREDFVRRCSATAAILLRPPPHVRPAGSAGRQRRGDTMAPDAHTTHAAASIASATSLGAPIATSLGTPIAASPPDAAGAACAGPLPPLRPPRRRRAQLACDFCRASKIKYVPPSRRVRIR